MTTDFRWAGREGEKIFSLACSRKMVSCIKADEDDCGWDFIIQYQPPTLLHVPTDQRDTGVSALVQVKATQVDAARWSISLKNALSLVNSPLPAFIVRVALDREDAHQFRAIHIWRPEIERILTAARRAYAQGDEALHRKQISFDFGQAADRPDLLEWMRTEIEVAGGRDYAGIKRTLVDTVGFEDGYGTASFRLRTSSPDALLDLQLGLIGPLELDYFSYTPSRFGIRAPEPEIECHGGKLEIIPEGRDARLKLRAPDGRQQFLPAKLFSGILPGGRRSRARVQAGCFDIVIRSRRRVSVKLSFDRKKKVPLDTLAAYALAHRSHRDSPLTVSLIQEKQQHDIGMINMDDHETESWAQLLLNIDAMKRLIAFENADPIHLSFHDVRRQFAGFSILEALINDRTLRMEFTPYGDGGSGPGKPVMFLSYTMVELGGVRIGAVASRPVVRDEMIGERRRMDMGPARLLHACVDEGCVIDIRELYLDEVDRLSETYDVMAIGDLMMGISDEVDRELILDRPRLPGHANEAASPRASAA